MSGVGQRLRLRLFLEGVEVPVIAATVQVLPNSPAQCSIQIPPSAEGTNLFPRTLVHLFFLDPYEVESPFAPPGPSNPQQNQSPTAYQQALAPDPNPSTLPSTTSTGDSDDVQNAKYKLLFGGEVVGFQWTKNTANRSLVLQCLDWSNYWDYAYQWNNTDLFGPGVKALFSGGSTNLFTDFLEDEGSAILRILQTPSIQYPKLQGLLGGIVHLLEAIGGSYYYGTQIAGENIFFSIAELRLHITQMITAYEKDPTASRLIGAGYDSLFGRTLGGLGRQVSVRQAINALMGIIFHETYAQPCPSYTPASGNTPAGSSRQSVRKDSNNAFIALVADDLLEGIQSVLEQVQAPSSPDTSSATAQASLIGSLSDMRGLCKTTTNKITDKSVAGARSLYAAAGRYLDQAAAAARSWVPGANASIVGKITTALNQADTQMIKASSFEVVTTSSGTMPARLNQQIFRPDVWFSAPPRCNVFFPENYNTLNYNRNFLLEPTRLLLKTNDESFGEDELFDQFYFAPKGFTLKTGRRELQAILSNDILDHELFTGILPVFEKMGELNIFAARSGTVNGEMPKVGLAQRSCNFLYFKYRFAARQLQLSGKFNPYLACGFPAVILDKYVTADAIALRNQLLEQSGGAATSEANALLGTHFLCNLTEVEHTISQSGGQTTVNCSYARQPEEKVEFLGVIRPDQTVQKRSNTDAARVSVVAAVVAPLVGSLGPNLGNITKVEDVTQAYQAQNVSSGRQLPYDSGPTRAGTTQAQINVPVGLTLPAGAYSLDVANLVGNPSQLVQFRAFRITENVPRYSTLSTDLPAEEYIRPGWYGDIWAPSQIGQAYQQFFSTGAITDQQQAAAANGASTAQQNAASQAALATAHQAVDADDPAGQAPGILALDQGSSIQDAVNFLVQVYSSVKQNGQNVDDFIRSYTWRPIATLVDIFGTSDLTFDSNGVSVVRGIEGFHSRAFGPYANLFTLVTPNIENIVGIKKGSTAAQRVDTRARKQRAVQEYVGAMQNRAILG